MFYHALIVGAGPVGSALARDIARAGFKVALVEEHPQVGEPVSCAGLVTPRTLEMAGASSRVVVRPITGARVHSASGQELALGGDRIRAVVIDRARFDQELAGQAQEAGAELYLETRVMGWEGGNDRLRVQGERGGRALTLEARLVVGADGVGSTVARRLGRCIGPPPEMVRCIIAEAKLQAQPPDAVQVFVGPGLAPGWFAWLIPAQEGWARLGLGTTDGQPLPPLLQKLQASFPRVFQGVELAQVRGGLIPLGPRHPFVAENVLLVGGAAAQVKPTSGGGLYPGLLAARFAAEAAIEALRQEDLRLLAGYPARWQAQAGREFQRSLDLRRAFRSLSDKDIDAILGLLCRPSFQRLVAGYGDIDYPSRLFSRFLKLAPLLQGLRHLPPSLWPRALGLALRWRMG